MDGRGEWKEGSVRESDTINYVEETYIYTYITEPRTQPNNTIILY